MLIKKNNTKWGKLHDLKESVQVKPPLNLVGTDLLRENRGRQH